MNSDTLNTLQTEHQCLLGQAETNLDGSGPGADRSDTQALCSFALFQYRSIRGLLIMRNNSGIPAPRHPDGYAGVISTEELRDCLRYSLVTCRHKNASRMHRCAHAAVHAMLCPCAWNEDCIVNAVKSELLSGDFVMTRPERDGPKKVSTSQVVETTRRSSTKAARCQRHERLDAALDEALAATFPASDPVALG